MLRLWSFPTAHPLVHVRRMHCSFSLPRQANDSFRVPRTKEDFIFPRACNRHSGPLWTAEILMSHVVMLRVTPVPYVTFKRFLPSPAGRGLRGGGARQRRASAPAWDTPTPTLPRTGREKTHSP